jgi:hypothetical protein
VHHHPRGFVENQEVGVLEEDIEGDILGLEPVLTLSPGFAGFPLSETWPSLMSV